MVQYTENQTKAITHRGHNILVSASAGSGKTAVLVQRVIEAIATIDVDQLLIVTFTELAAKEMKDRIRAAVETKISDLQNDAAQSEQLNHYRRQLNRLNLANISTIHAFCQNIIHKFYYLINIDPEFTILADAAQAMLLKQSAFADLREAYYNQDDLTFFQLTENFSNDRDDAGLEAAVFKIYEYMQAFPDPTAWLNQLTENYQNQPELLNMPVYQTTVLPELQRELTQLENDVVVLQQDFQDQQLERHAEAVATILPKIKQTEAALQLGYTALRTNLIDVPLDAPLKVGQWPRLKKPEKEAGHTTAEVNALKETVVADLDEIEALKEAYFGLPEQTLRIVNDQCQTLITKLIEVVQKFATAYQQLKQDRGLLDFSDLEHDAHAILTTKDATGQLLAQNFYQQKFNEVLIDEYQDINPLQEALLQLVAKTKPGNRFMVGDIKQSIYGFRMAEPKLFAQKYVQYADQPGSAAADERIILSDNFRSKQAITNFVNFIFAQIMDTQLGDIDYDKKAYLNFGAKYYTDGDNPVEVLMAQAPEDDSAAENQPSVAPMILAAAQRIQQLIAAKTLIYDGDAPNQQRLLTYQDIAILVRSRTLNTDIVDTFKRAAIPVLVSDTENYFKTTELQIMLSLLQLVDNLDQDIPLVAVLRSPMYAFDENELGFIRGQQTEKNKSFYDCLQLVTAEKLTDPEICRGDFSQRLVAFDQDMTLYRDIARSNQIATLIWTIYDRTGFLDYVGGMPSGPQRQANLNALYDRAKQYEETGFKGVFQFVRFIQQMQKNNKDLAQPNLASERTNAVQVITIHGSKGLEFPVVIGLGLEHGFNKKDISRSYILDQKLGLGLTYLTSKRVKIPTIQKSAIAQEATKKLLSEELRLLYVALTRAKQRLILVATCPKSGADSETELLDQWAKAAGNQLALPLNTKLKAKSFLDFVGPALVRGVKNGALKPYYQPGLFTALPHEVVVTFKQPTPTFTAATTVTQNLPKTVIQVDQAFTDLVQQRFDLAYDNLAATKTTAYQAVSDIKRQFDDPDLDILMPLATTPPELAATTPALTTANLREPEFLKATNAVSAAQIGTATHLVLQRLPLDQPVTAAVITQTIADLEAKQLLTPTLASKIKPAQILAFFTGSALGTKISAQPKNYHREVTFSMVYPATKLFPKINSNHTRNVLIHGMIDGYYQSKDELILVDYKTDHKTNQEILENYQGQLNLYALALTKMCGQAVSAKYLYSLQNKTLILVP
ncbi:helicase-exonuclease AddAB subunit AddA [Agrilactobacillus yilanensis]|uniref:ATP-dependent helicase/nuclease subunit A n=1 Tax=Agrilactobacillus yilanensis TaxID=2485997 RepID=A0ABW4J9E5_9LACO|nr:helicase-exonuclease AddAB subunit AddA [Agrilactobacillus yilanensis]